MIKLRILAALAALVGVMAPLTSSAESNIQTGTGALSASSKLDFRITVPKMLYLRVGTSAAGLVTNGTVDLIDYVVPAGNNGDGTVLAATAGSGDLGNGAVTAKVIGNAGNITFTSTTTGALGNGAGDTISFTKIAAASAVLTSAIALPHPTFVDGGTSTPLTLTAVSKVVNQDARWTFTYLNNAIAPAGTFGGVNTNNSRVTYTAVLP